MKRIIWTVAAMIPLSGCGAIQSAALHKEVQDNQVRAVAANDRCKSGMDQDPALEPLRGKVELYRTSFVNSPPFSVLANTGFPSELELKAIAHWAEIREACQKESDAAFKMPSAAYSNQRDFVNDLRNMLHAQAGSVNSLVVALYQQKVSYGEFAQKRFDINRDTSLAISDMRRAAEDRDMQRASIAQQNFANIMGTWSAYIAAVNARPVVIVHYR